MADRYACVDYAAEHGRRAAAALYGVCVSQVARWQRSAELHEVLRPGAPDVEMVA